MSHSTSRTSADASADHPTATMLPRKFASHSRDGYNGKNGHGDVPEPSGPSTKLAAFVTWMVAQ